MENAIYYVPSINFSSIKKLFSFAKAKTEDDELEDDELEDDELEDDEQKSPKRKPKKGDETPEWAKTIIELLTPQQEKKKSTNKVPIPKIPEPQEEEEQEEKANNKTGFLNWLW